MIAFGCVTGSDEAFRERAGAAMQRVVEGDSLLLRRHRPDSLADAIDGMLDDAARHDDLEAVALFDQDATIDAPNFLPILRSAIDVAVDLGLIGAAPAPPLEGLITPGRQNGTLGSMEEVEAVDGRLLVFSPWAARELRPDREFDWSLDGCAVDLCLQARTVGRQVALVGLGVGRQPPLDPPPNGRPWEAVEKALRQKWSA